MKKQSSEYEKWLKSHKCHLNHDGSAGAMEPPGGFKFFARSERNLRHMKYLGDGDSTSFIKNKTNHKERIEKVSLLAIFKSVWVVD